MSRSRRKRKGAPGGLLAASGLLERLTQVQKRKRAFGGQTIDMEAIRRRLEAQQRQNRDG